MDEDYNKLKSEILTSNQRRKDLYNEVLLLPQEVLNEIPYKKTLEALEQGDTYSLGFLI